MVVVMSLVFQHLFFNPQPDFLESLFIDFSRDGHRSVPPDHNFAERLGNQAAIPLWRTHALLMEI